ncbi:MAG TPA: hypothetical protein VGQ65_25815 [Thermoanaerobaculia bacterium]|jgi:hypothetical protein|nr:hypothetical protein [Thermoanaerobaculia bacterium]
MEDWQERLARYLDGRAVNIFGWMTIWAQNELLPQIAAVNKPNFETLLFLGTHSFIQAFMESVYDLRGLAGTKAFLERFMDESSSSNQFSLIAREVHEMRNVLAHQLYAIHTHHIAYDYRLAGGWERRSAMLHINPVVYGRQFGAALDGGRLTKWRKWTTPESLTVQKWRFIIRWLGLPKTDPLAQAVKALLSLTPDQIARGTPAIRKMFAAKYGV